MSEQQMTIRDHYLEQMVESAGQDGLLILLVEGAVNFIRRAEVALERGKWDEVNNCLIKAQNIYLELTITLDLDSGKFAENMAHLYQFLYNLLIEANLEKDINKIRTALKIGEQIRDIWKESVAKMRAESRPEGEKAQVAALEQKVARTGVYVPHVGKGIAEEEPKVENVPSRLNITG